MAMKDDKGSGLNSILIPRDWVSFQKRPKLLWKDPPPEDHSANSTGRFDTGSYGSTSAAKDKKGNKSATSSTKRSPSQNSAEMTGTGEEKNSPADEKANARRSYERKSGKAAPSYASKKEEDTENQESAGESKKAARQDYMKEFLKKKNDTTQTGADRKAEGDKAIQKRLDKEKEDNMSSRARWLADEIVFWKNKRGTGEFEESVINQTIENYEREYFGIDQRFRPF